MFSFALKFQLNPNTIRTNRKFDSLYSKQGNQQKVQKAHTRKKMGKTRKSREIIKHQKVLKKARAIRHYLPDLLHNAVIQRSRDINQFGNWLMLLKTKTNFLIALKIATYLKLRLKLAVHK